jgi:hypothetical protein
MSRTLNLPRPVRVRTAGGGVPAEVDGQAVAQVRESWLVEDRWWSERPLRRRYWEVVSAGGRNMVVFHDLLAGSAPGARKDRNASGAEEAGWFTQGA